jgi:glutathione synthase
MQKKILFVCDSLEHFNLKTDTTYFLMVTAAELNLEVAYCYTQDLYLENNQAFANPTTIKLLAKNSDEPGTIMPWFMREVTQHQINLNEFAAVLVRNDPPFDMEYYYLTQILSLAEHHGARIFNNSNVLRNFNEKLAILNFPELITPTIVTKNKTVIKEFLAKHEDCVIKPLDLMAGRGIFKLSLADPNCAVILENSTNYFTQTVMVQKFIPEVIYGDRRIFIVHGEVIGHCLYRIPESGAIRGNIAAGGHGEVHPLTKDDYVIANCVAKWLVAHNIVFAGIDVIGNKLTEVNITSPTGTRQIFNYSGINIPKLLISQLIT